jgi:hypothetical protein
LRRPIAVESALDERLREAGEFGKDRCFIAKDIPCIEKCLRLIKIFNALAPILPYNFNSNITLSRGGFNVLVSPDAEVAIRKVIMSSINRKRALYSPHHAV